MLRTGLLLLLGLAATLSAQEAKVGCVDIAGLLREHPTFVAKRDAARDARKGALEALKARRDKLVARGEELEIYQEGSPEFFKVSEEIALERATIELDREITLAEYNLALVEGIKAAYRDIVVKVQSVAKERGIVIVAQIHSRELRGLTQREVLTEIFSQPFVHYDESLDLTEAVRALL